MQLVQTNKRYIPNKVFLGVPPVINNERCINVEFKNGFDIFEYCDENEPLDLKNINGIFFK